MKQIHLYLFVAGIFFTSADVLAQWQLVWQDNFNYTGFPDSTKWSYEEGYIRNNELQYYTSRDKNNAWVDHGVLTIMARQDKQADPAITSASIHTAGKAEFKYGKFEVSAKLPTGVGTWPAIWMLGTNIEQVGWPECGEIDIMENVGFDPEIIHANVHTEKYNHVKGTNKGDQIQVEMPYADFHTYTVEWGPELIEFFLDDQKYFSFTNEHIGEAAWPFDQPFYLIINLAIGGAWGGQQGLDESIFPQYYEIDYVRVYKKE
ncbi:MAG: glycoside hydrolase family 16 protein [Candidatus Cyclobacteriaceae bacterium M3_2C_046]